LYRLRTVMADWKTHD